MALIVFSFAAIATVSGLKVFESWSQVSTLWESEINPMQIIGHPHMPRYLVAYPGFLLEELLPSVGFSLYIAVFFASNVVLLREVALLTIQRRPSIGIYLCFAAIHLVMNGRGVIVWTAWLICIWVCHKIKMKSSSPMPLIFWIVISCLLAAVSTGAFIVVAIALSFILLRRMRFAKRMSLNRWLILLAVAVPVGYELLKYFILAVEKNINYYGGGIEGVFYMLEHGLGVIFFEGDLLQLLIIFFALFFLGSIIIALVARRRFFLLDGFAVLSIIGGLFGFTVLAMLIPILLLKIQVSIKLFKSCRLKPQINNEKILGNDKSIVTHYEVESRAAV